MPSLPKPPDRRIGHHRNDLGIVSADLVQSSPPPAPPGVLAATVRDWEAAWSSPLAQAWNVATDLPALTRLFQLVDEAERYRRAAKKEPLVEGSTGQVVANPLLKLRDGLLGEIRQLEDRFGLSPQARLKLGLTFAESVRSIDALNAAIVSASVDDADPRLPGGDDAA